MGHLESDEGSAKRCPTVVLGNRLDNKGGTGQLGLHFITASVPLNPTPHVMLTIQSSPHSYATSPSLSSHVHISACLSVDFRDKPSNVIWVP